MKCNRESLYINGAYGNRHTQINIKCTRFVIIHGKNRLLTARTNIALKRKYILQNKRHEKHQAFAKILTEFSIWSTKTRCSKHLSVQHNFTSKYGQSHALAQSGLFDWRSLFCDFAARQDNWQKKKKTQDAIHTRLFPLHRRTAAAFCWRHQCNPSGDIVVSYAIEPEFSFGQFYAIYGQLNFIYELVWHVEGILVAISLEHTSKKTLI